MKTIPRIKIAHLPTPVESLPRLSAYLGGPSIFIKRDDMTGLAMGGNKTRKLEYLFAEAQTNGARTVITTGAVQSNHCRQTAAAAARLNFKCILVLSGEKPASATGNLLLDQFFNAEIVWTSLDERNDTLQKIFQSAWDQGLRPYLIPYGGSNASGAAAYAYAFQELLTQNIETDWIVFASSSGGTQAGLVAGARIFDYQGKVLGVSVDEPEVILQERVTKLANLTLDILGEKCNITQEDVLICADYLGGGYGILGTPEIEAIGLFAQLEGLLLDPVYTGRAAAGMIDLIKKGYFKKSDRILFWHTGGTPALFADKYTLLAHPL